MSFQNCCAQEAPGGGGGGKRRVHPSPHQVTPSTRHQEPRNSSLTRWIVMKIFVPALRKVKAILLIQDGGNSGAGAGGGIKIQGGPVRQSVLHLLPVIV